MGRHCKLRLPNNKNAVQGYFLLLDYRLHLHRLGSHLQAFGSKKKKKSREKFPGNRLLLLGQSGSGQEIAVKMNCYCLIKISVLQQAQSRRVSIKVRDLFRLGLTGDGRFGD